MKQLDTKDLASSLPVLPRLDRLDLLLQVLEEKQGMSPKYEKGKEENSEYCRSTLSLSTALEQVHHKGTLVDRLTALENRVLKLSLEMEEGNTSRSSSSSKSRNHDNDLKQEEASKACLSSEKTDKVVGNAKMTKKKWRIGSWLRLGCN